jgi:hypothetical protein
MGRAPARRGNGALVAAAAAALLLVAGLGAYGRAAILNERAFADRAAAALERPDVRAEVALRLRERLFGEPASPAMAEAIDAAVRDPRFEPLFRAGAARMHAALFARGDEAVRLELPGAMALVRAANESSGTVAESSAAPALLTVGGGGGLERGLRGAAPEARAVAAWWPAALVLAFGLLVLAGRRHAGLAIAAAGAVAAAGTLAAEALLLRTFTSRHGDAVVDAIWDSYLADLRIAGVVAAALGVALAVRWRWPWSQARSGRPAGASSPAGSSTPSPR